jgi:hypothetical protein
VVSDSENEQILEEGDYSLPFQIDLDDDLPTSLEHAHARIRYILRAIVDIPWEADVCAMLSFSVLNLLDLNTVKPSLKKPFELTDSKTVGCFPFCSKTVNIRFSVNKCAFVPGERVKFTVEILNSSHAEIGELRVSLTRVIKVFADGVRSLGEIIQRDKSYKKKMGFVAFPKDVVAANSEEKWTGTYRIPATCPTYTDSSVLKISYVFSLCMNVPGRSFLFDDDLGIPVTIGTIPMIETVPEALAASLTNASSYAMAASRAMSGRGRSNSVISLPNDSFYSLETGGGDKDDLPPPYEFDDANPNEQGMQSDSESYRPFYIYYKDFSINI